ncbi:hypothetical protein B0I37DRAFT_358855 [Chaetomium sp. MPI-CAGE-AT-0009]|nr:hypothetical protein B0I37DRAFT_358855 [Chaetomium sp. MPI-CAGE-AT-0009]
MNRHFLGPPNGLPLESFTVKASETVWTIRQRSLLPWREGWSARILQDELFLSATRTLSGAGWTDETLHAALDNEGREVCGHVRMASHIPVPSVKALRRTSRVFPGYFLPCRDVFESCSQCLTDYTTTIERRGADAEQTSGYWFITITSYHQLGSGRSAADAKFEGFGRLMTVAAYRMRRDMVAHPPGAVRRVWDSYKP